MSRRFDQVAHDGPLPACRTCGAPTALVSGACGTWLRCTTGPLDYHGRASSHDAHVDSADARTTRVAFICASTGWNRDNQPNATAEDMTDRRDTRATYRDLIRHHRDAAWRAHGLTPNH